MLMNTSKQAAEQPSFLPDHNAQYLDAKYWDERFQKVPSICTVL